MRLKTILTAVKTGSIFVNKTNYLLVTCGAANAKAITQIQATFSIWRREIWSLKVVLWGESPPYSSYTLYILEHASSLPGDKWGPPDVIKVRWHDTVEHLKVARQVVPGWGGGFAKVQVVLGRELEKEWWTDLVNGAGKRVVNGLFISLI